MRQVLRQQLWMSELRNFSVNPSKKPEQEEQFAKNSDENSEPAKNSCHAYNFVSCRNIRLMPAIDGTSASTPHPILQQPQINMI
jgi:hypothetical protein